MPAKQQVRPAAAQDRRWYGGMRTNFAVERTPVAEGIRVAVLGEVDIETAPRLRQALTAALSSGQPVLVDLGAVTFMDSGGLAVLIAAHRTAAAAGQAFRLRAVPAQILRLFRITGLDAVLDVVPPTEDDPAD